MHTRSVLLLALATAGCGKADPAAQAGPSPTTPGVGGGDAKPVKAPPRGAERVAYSLVDNRLSSHLTRGGGLLLPAGSAAFAKYVRFPSMLKGGKKTWDLRATDGGVKVAKMTGRQASVFVPLTKDQASRGKIRIRIDAKDAGALTVKINEKKDINTSVKKGWQTVEVDGAANLVEGENSIQLYTKGEGATVAWIQIGGTMAVGDDGAVTFYDGAKKALMIPQGGASTYYLQVPDKAKLTGDLDNGACSVTVTATADDGATAKGKLSGVGSAVDLSSIGGRAARVELEAAGCEQAALANAALVLPGAEPAIKRGDAPKYVLFVIMDSLRADKIKLWNPKARPDVPNFEKLAESSAVFMHHYSMGTESQVSHASMWTSMYLVKHKASEMADKLPDKYVTIDEVAKKAGKFTAGVSANGYIRPSRGFGGGWNKFANHIEQGGGLKAADVANAGLKYITAVKDQPWFLYLGFIDTHVTWRAKSPWIEKYDGGYKGRFSKEFGDEPNGFPKDVNEQEKDHVRAIYDSNVSYQDDQLGKVIAKLTEWGIYDQTMLIVTADHGDELWEDGRTIGHAQRPRQTIVHVPMLIHYPPMFPAGKIVSGTEGIDIVPTIADALGVALDGEWQGSSMIPAANGATPYGQLAIATQYENFHVGWLGNYKLKLAGTGTPTLHRLDKDPGEKSDLWGEKAGAVATRMLLDPMWIQRQWATEWKKSQWGNAANVSSKFAADLGE